MEGFQVVPFEAWHIKIESLREHEQELLRSWGDYQVRLGLFSKVGPAWTIFKDGRFISAGGVIPLCCHVGEAWQFPSKELGKHKIGYGRIYRERVEAILAAGRFKRIQTSCLNDELHNRWMQFLKFEKEGVLRGFGNGGEDFVMYARLQDGR
jgi:hypothetical protein